MENILWRTFVLWDSNELSGPDHFPLISQFLKQAELFVSVYLPVMKNDGSFSSGIDFFFPLDSWRRWRWEGSGEAVHFCHVLLFINIFHNASQTWGGGSLIVSALASLDIWDHCCPMPGPAKEAFCWLQTTWVEEFFKILHSINSAFFYYNAKLNPGADLKNNT